MPGQISIGDLGQNYSGGNKDLASTPRARSSPLSASSGKRTYPRNRRGSFSS